MADASTTKKSVATVIFNEKIEIRNQGGLSTNKEFRKVVIEEIIAKTGTTLASASSMFAVLKNESEKAGLITLGRDKKVDKKSISITVNSVDTTDSLPVIELVQQPVVVEIDTTLINDTVTDTVEDTIV